MPSRTEIAKKLSTLQQSAHLACDTVRRKHLKDLAEYTRRETVIYFSNERPIEPDDVRGFMSAFHELKGDQLDLILHSKGGSSEATEQIVSYARKKFKHIRAIIPERAMSAATMLSCACDEIVMGKQSAIGPIDPQFSFGPGVSIPAHAILEDLARAVADVKADPRTAALWVPKLNKIPHGLISMCEQTIRRSQEVVTKWLEDYQGKTPQQAAEIAEWLASYSHKSHAKPIDAVQAKSKGLNITFLEDDQKFQDKVLSVFHATALTFETNPCLKLTENNLGKGYYLLAQPQIQMIPQMPIFPPQQIPVTPPAPSPTTPPTGP